MLQNKKVKIYVDVWNCEKYLRQCIESVLTQTYTNFEFHIVDNGSKDSCPQIITEYAQKDSRIIATLSNENIQARWCDWVDDWDDDCYFTVIDHDDWWEESFLEKTINYLENNNLDIVYCQHKQYFQNNNIFKNSHKDIGKPYIFTKHTLPSVYCLVWRYMSTVWSCISKVSIMKNSNMRAITKQIQETRYISGPDTLIMLEYMKICNTIGVIPDYLYNYRKHDEASTEIKTYNPLGFESVVYRFTKTKEYTDSNNVKSIRNDEWLNSIFSYELIDKVITKIPNTELTNEEKIQIYNEVFTHEITLNFLKTSRDEYYTEMLELFPPIIKLYDIENFDVIKNCIAIISPKSSVTFNKDTLAIFQNNDKLLKALVNDDNLNIALEFVELLEKDEKNIILPLLHELLEEDNLIRTINSTAFWYKYKNIAELLINSKLEEVFDIMTDIIMVNKNIYEFENLINLYINLSNQFGVEIGVLVGKLKLAEYLQENGDIEQSRLIAIELLQLGLQSEELDELVSKLK